MADYDGVLVFGKAIAEIYRSRNWAKRVWVWHEAADMRVFMPLPDEEKEAIWSGSATGAMKNARRNCMNFFSSR